MENSTEQIENLNKKEIIKRILIILSFYGYIILTIFLFLFSLHLAASVFWRFLEGLNIEYNLIHHFICYVLPPLFLLFIGDFVNKRFKNIKFFHLFLIVGFVFYFFYLFDTRIYKIKELYYLLFIPLGFILSNYIRLKKIYAWIIISFWILLILTTIYLFYRIFFMEAGYLQNVGALLILVTPAGIGIYRIIFIIRKRILRNDYKPIQV